MALSGDDYEVAFEELVSIKNGVFDISWREIIRLFEVYGAHEIMKCGKARCFRWKRTKKINEQFLIFFFVYSSNYGESFTRLFRKSLVAHMNSIIEKCPPCRIL